MGFYSGARITHLTSEGYLEFLDGKLGLTQGTLFNLCVMAVKSKVEAREGITVTYRGVTKRLERLTPHKFVQVRKAVFLIEFRMTKAGKQYNRVVQVHLKL